MYEFVRQYIFRSDPEKAHEQTLALLGRAGRNPMGTVVLKAMYRRTSSALETTVAGLRFPNPVGLAAGYDKDAVAVEGLFALGFGFVEVGTVTPRSQPGNPKPRLFRYPEDEAVINRMGFNNCGAAALAVRLAAIPRQPGPLGVNLGKNKATPNETAHNDYTTGLSELFPYADYFVINVSSPNTPELRQLQTRTYLEDLLGRVQRQNQASADTHGGRPKPVFVKIAPDLTADALDDIIHAVLNTGLSGVIATNTTVEREGLTTYSQPQEGGLSGKPLTPRARQIVAAVYRRLRGRLPIIGVGGIMSDIDAQLMIRAGASLIQVYTGLIYRGPSFPAQLVASLESLANEQGAAGLRSLVGVDASLYPEL